MKIISQQARRESEHLVRYFGIVTLLVAIVLALVLAPLSTCSHAVYIITILTFSLFVIFYFGLLRMFAFINRTHSFPILIT